MSCCKTTFPNLSGNWVGCGAHFWPKRCKQSSARCLWERFSFLMWVSPPPHCHFLLLPAWNMKGRPEVEWTPYAHKVTMGKRKPPIKDGREESWRDQGALMAWCATLLAWTSQHCLGLFVWGERNSEPFMLCMSIWQPFIEHIQCTRYNYRP